MLTKHFNYAALRPVWDTVFAPLTPIRLPVGVNLALGQAIANLNLAAANEVRTFTFTGSPTGGSLILQWVAGNTIYQSLPIPYNATLTQFQAAMAAIWPTGITCTGSAGGPFTVTFGGMLGDVNIAGTFSVINSLTGGTTPTATWVQTTPGSAGAGQFAIYGGSGASDGTQNCKGFLYRPYISDPFGGSQTEYGSAQTPYSPQAYINHGAFRVGDLLGVGGSSTLDSNIITTLAGSRLFGTSITDATAIIVF